MNIMRDISSLAAIILFAALTSTGASAARRYAPPPDSYLNHSVYSVNGLVQQVEADPAVRQRYAHHFLHIPPDQLARWMRNNLVTSWVPQTKQYLVYCVSPSGRYFQVKQTFRKGTKVFALRDGTPLMKWVCGNPLFEYEAQKVSSNLVTTKTSPTVNQLAETMRENLLPLGATVLPLSLSGFGPSGVVTRVGPSLSSLAAVAAAFPALGLFSNNGGGGGASPRIPPVAVPVVPEPSPFGLLTVALPVVLVAAVRRRNGHMGEGNARRQLSAD